MLFAARVMQGLGTGLVTGALSAWLLDLQPPDNPRLGSLVASVAPVAGLAAGALVCSRNLAPIRYISCSNFCAPSTRSRSPRCRSSPTSHSGRQDGCSR
jgi:MFS family permease